MRVVEELEKGRGIHAREPRVIYLLHKSTIPFRQLEASLVGTLLNTGSYK